MSNLTQYANSVTAVTVVPKSGKSGGAVTVYYNGSTSLPSAAGAYTVTFDVAEVDGWKAATGLAGGKLAIILPGQTLVDNLDEATAYLSAADGGESEENAVYFLVNIDLNSTAGGASGWQQLLDAIADADKFITLDLSLCAMTGTEFDPVSSFSTGKDKVISLTLPVVAKSITGENNDSTFKNFDSLKTASGAYVTTIGTLAFYKCSTLTEAYFPLAESIGGGAFWDCSSLTEANFPLAESIGRYTFIGCSSLIEASFPLVESIDYYAFDNCSSLIEANFPLAESIDDGAFRVCSSLTEASMIKVKLFPKEYFFF